MEAPVGGDTKGFRHDQAYRLSNTTYSEIAPCLPLPVLPVFCGADDPELRLFNEAAPRNLNRPEILAHAAKVAALLKTTDVSYLSIKRNFGSCASAEPGSLLYEVLHYDADGFKCSTPGSNRDPNLHKLSEKKHVEHIAEDVVKGQNMSARSLSDHSDRKYTNDNLVSDSSKKFKIRKGGNEDMPSFTEPNLADVHDSFVRGFCQMVDEICSRAENTFGDQDDTESTPLPLSDMKFLVNEILAMRSKKILHLVPVDTLVRLLSVLDRQILHGHGLSIEESENFESGTILLVLGALEATHASLAIMTYKDMPKQLYKEELIDRIIDFSRHQIMDCMLACDPAYRALHKPRDDDALDGDGDENDDTDLGSGGKKNRRPSKTVKTKKAANKISNTVNTVLQKLCTILGSLKDLLSIERLADSSILQLVKTSFTTFLVDNVQILQLKAIMLISAVCSSYLQHRKFLIDETLQVLWKLPSKRSFRCYHLSDEQIQIQMVTALLIQLVQCSTSSPFIFREALASDDDSVLETSNDACQPNKCHEAATEACCHFWSSILHRWTTIKTQDGLDLKGIMENLVMDLLTTYNLPEYPASANILEVLCVLLLQNAVLKSKDVATRCMAIDLLGTVAARLKHDAAILRGDKFWVLEELHGEPNGDIPKEVCCVCFGGRGGTEVITCHGCQRCFHNECVGLIGKDTVSRSWFCSLCLSRNQLKYLHSYWRSKCKSEEIKNHSAGDDREESLTITGLDVVRQTLLNCLQASDSMENFNLIIRWFYLCLWYKDEAKSRETFLYYLIRLKSKEIWDVGAAASMFSRELAKKVSFALGRNRSFARGFDKIFDVLLKNLQENSPVLRAKALRAVSVIVEADPEVLCEKRVQHAVEGRFSDSAISVREAALELINRYISSHPDVATKYFEKVAERVKDTGVSVRKRAIKIIRDMCVSNEHFSGSMSACLQIITRINDDESSVQDLVCKTFYEFWFEESSNIPTQYVGDNSCIPVEIAKKTEQIVDMLRKMSNHQPLITLVRRTLALDFLPQSSKATGINAVSLASVRKRGELMCKCLLERILQVEENNNEEVEVRALPYVLALHAFCVVDPTICAPPADPSQFLVTLMPYLKSQVNNRAVAQMLQSIVFIIDAVLPLLRRPPSSFIEELEQDLKQTILRYSFLNVVHACIKCLCTLSRISSRGASSVMPLIQRFFKHLDVSKDTTGADNEQAVQRSLFCLGQLIRYSPKSGIFLDHEHFSIAKVLSLLKGYLCSESFNVKVRSLQALGFIMIAMPEYMMENDIEKIVGAALSPSSDTRLKALQNIHEYLVDTEGEMVIEAHKNSANQGTVGSGHEVPVVAGSSDSNICGGIIQLHWNSILDNCLDVNEQVRQAALKIVEVVLRQGLVHPITSVPYLIALETDQLELNSKLAHHLLMNMNEKYPAFFENRLGDGLQMSFNFIQSRSESSLDTYNCNKVHGNTKVKNDNSILSFAKLGISRIYRLIRGNRVSRNKFISSVVRKFDSGTWNNSTTSFLVYCTEILSSLPFTLPDEPLYLVYTINRVIQVRAGALESSMKALSSEFNHDLSFGTSQNGTVENHLKQEHLSSIHDFANTKAEAFIPSPTCPSVSDEDQNKFKADCQAAIALRLLMKLKRYLKTAYDPAEALKPGEVLSKLSFPFDLQDISFNLATTHQEMLVKYQEFKAALKEDTIDYAVYTANVNRKRSRSSGMEAGNGYGIRKVPARSSRNSKPVQDVRNDDEADIDDGWMSGYYRASGRSGRGRR
ncbi:Nipped-B-like protein b [Nymphaea thermarum]|nr:Nipped-B-like protein b [Nymphaea thermarum]